jgi:nitrate reductase (cytochrome), electron transfer subunit
MRLHHKAVLAATILAVLYGCAQFAGVSTLRGSDAGTVDQAPPVAKAYVGKRPGTGATLIPKDYKELPPLIPHAIENFDEITVAENQCLECHSVATAKAKNAPPVGERHLAGGVLVMSRYQCNTCHVPQVDAAPLVVNTFAGAPRGR